MVANPFENLGSTFQAQQQQAGLAELLSQDQFKQIQALNDPTTNLALQRQTATVQGNLPTINTKVDAVGPFDGLVKGVTQGMDNRRNVQAYNQQVKASQDIQNSYLQSQAQNRELVMGQIQAQHQNDLAAQQYLQGTNPGLAGLYPYMDAAHRQSSMGEAATKEIGMQYAPAEGTAAGQAQVNKGAAINAAVGQMAPVEIGGVPIPGRMDAVQNIQGHAPTTTLGVNKDILANQGQLIQNQSDANKLGVQPVQLQQDIQKNALDIQIQKVNAQFADQAKQLDIKRDQLANQKGTLDYQKGLGEYKRFQQGQALFKTLQEAGTLNTNDETKQAEIQAQLGIYGIKYDPPNSKFSTIKHKDGTIYQVDSLTGQVRPIIGKNGKPSFGPWQTLGQ